MRLGRDKKRNLTWHVGGVQPTLTATAADTNLKFALGDDIAGKWTLVRLLLWCHVLNTDGAGAAGRIVFMRCGIDTEANGSFTILSPADDDNVNGNRGVLAWEPIWLAPAGNVDFGTGTFHHGRLFFDIKSGRLIDGARESVTVTFRSAATFSATVNYRMLVVKGG